MKGIIMNQELINKLEAIDKQIQEVLKELKGRKDQNNPLSDSISKATNKTTNDQDYVEALKVLKNLPFRLSVNQFCWCIAFAKYHPTEGDSIVDFFKSQLKKSDDVDEFVEQVATTLRKKYTNDYNQEYIEKTIILLNELKSK